MNKFTLVIEDEEANYIDGLLRLLAELPECGLRFVSVSLNGGEPLTDADCEQIQREPR